MILDTIAKKTENRVEMLKEEMPLEKIKENYIHLIMIMNLNLKKR